MWFRNLIVYSVPKGWDLAPEALAQMLAPQAFAPGTGLEEGSIG